VLLGDLEKVGGKVDVGAVVFGLLVFDFGVL
jgi:hypothetical protein